MAPLRACLLIQPPGPDTQTQARSVGSWGGRPIYFKFIDLMIQQTVLQRDGDDPDLRLFSVSRQRHGRCGLWAPTVPVSHGGGC